jgi:hypothetical protein
LYHIHCVNIKQVQPSGFQTEGSTFIRHAEALPAQAVFAPFGQQPQFQAPPPQFQQQQSFIPPPQNPPPPQPAPSCGPNIIVRTG